ncbi:MAG: translation initiation factor IF-3 [Armatimonadetes bacterium]|nr:translation initiation factor IF-3 [Armatimonadota bacterium]
MRLLGPHGEQVGIIQTRKALQMAEDAELDLVMVAQNVHPPVCRIVDHGKYKYEQRKREKEARAKRKTQDVKGIKMKPGTAMQDLRVLLRKAVKFLEEGHKVRFTVRLHPRETGRPEVAKEKLAWFLEQMGDSAQVVKPMGVQGRELSMVVIPVRRSDGGKADAETKDKQDSGEKVQDNRQRQDNPAQSV